MWPFRNDLRIHMESLWINFALVLVLLPPKLNAASSNSVLSSGFVSSVLPSISTNILYPSIQNVTSSTNGGFSTAGKSSNLAYNATVPVQLPSNATLNLPSSSIMKTETSAVFVSDTKTFINQTETVSLQSSKSFSASYTGVGVVMSANSSNYSLSSSSSNSSSAVLSTKISEIRVSSTSSQLLQTSRLSASFEQSSLSVNKSYMIAAVSSVANLSDSISTARTLSLPRTSSSIEKIISSKSQLSHARTTNGSLTGLPSQSMAESPTLHLETSHMVLSSATETATNRTLSASYLTSSTLINASRTVSTSPSILGVSVAASVSATAKSVLKSEVLSRNDTIVMRSATIHETPVMGTVKSSVRAVITTPTSVPTSNATMSINQSVPDMSAVSPSRSVNQTVSAVKTTALPSSKSFAVHTLPVPSRSIGEEVNASLSAFERSSLLVPQNATSQSLLASLSSPVKVSSSMVSSKNVTAQSLKSVLLHPSTVIAPLSTMSVGKVAGLSSPMTSKSVPLPISPMTPGVSSALAFSQNVTSQSKKQTALSPTASVTPKKTSTEEGLIVTSYATPCYIYYVVEKTVLPVETANHTVVPSTPATPKITLDIESASRIHSGLPTVTLTHTAAMTTRAHSQVAGSSSTVTSSSGLVRISVTNIESTPTHLLSVASPSEIPTVHSSDASKIVQTVSLAVPSLMTLSMSGSILKDRKNATEASTPQTGMISTHLQSKPSQSGTLAIPGVTASVSELHGTPITNKTLGPNSVTPSDSFTPVVASASISEMKNMSSTKVSGTQSSMVQINTTSLVASNAVPTVAEPLPSTRIVSGFSQNLSSDNISSTTRSFIGFVSPSKSGTLEISFFTSQSATVLLSKAALSSTYMGTSSDGQVVASPSRQVNITGSPDILALNVTGFTQMPSPTTRGNLPSAAANKTSTPVLLRSLATTSQTETLSTVPLQVNLSATEIYKASTSPLVMGNVSATVSQVDGLNTQISSSPRVAASSLSLVADNVTASSSMERIPSPSAIHLPSNTSSSVGAPQSSVTLSQTGTVNIQSSSDIHVPSSGNASIGEPKSSVILPLATTASQVGGVMIPFSSSRQVAASKSFSQTGSTSLAAERLSSPSSAILEASSSIPSGAKRRRKRAAFGDPTLGVQSPSSAVLNHSVAETLAYSSQRSGQAASVLPSSPMASQTLETGISVSQSAEVAQGGSSQVLVPTSVSKSSVRPQNASVSPSVSSPKEAASYSLPQGNSTQTVVVPSASPSTSYASEQKPAGNATSVPSPVLVTPESATSSFYLSPSQHANVTDSVSQSAEVAQGGSSQVLVPTSVSKPSVRPQNASVSLNVSSPKVAASYSLPQGNSTQTVVVPSASPSTSYASEQKSAGNATSVPSPVLVTPGSATSSFYLSPSQHANITDRHTVLATASPSSAPLYVSVIPSGNLTTSRGMVVPSLNKESSVPRPSEAVKSMTAHAKLSVTNVGTVEASSTGVLPSANVSLPATSGSLPTTVSLGAMESSVLLGNTTFTLAHSVTAVPTEGVVASASFIVVVPSPSSVALEKSLTQQPLNTSVAISSPSTVGSSSIASTASMSAVPKNTTVTPALSKASSSISLSSETVQLFSSSVVTLPSPSAVKSSAIQQTVVSSSATIASSSRVYRPPLVTVSSLGMCYVVYTTRIVQPSLVTTQPFNLSSTASVNVSFTPGFSVNMTSSQMSTSISFNASSSTVVRPTLEVNATRAQSSQMVSTTVHVNFTVKPSSSSSGVLVISKMPSANATTSRAASTVAKSSAVSQMPNVSQSAVQTSSTSNATRQISSVVSTTQTTYLPKSPSVAKTEVPSFIPQPTSQVISPTGTASQVVSTSVTVPTPAPRDPSLLVEAIFNVPNDRDIQSQEFKKELEVNLADAYAFAEVTLRRRRRATPEINVTIDNIQRVNNAGDVNVTFFVTQDGRQVPATEAVQNYQKLSKAQLGSLIKLDVVSMPEALVVPPTPSLPSNILVSLIIEASASENISIAANKKKLEDNLASYYEEKKKLTPVTATITTIIHEPNGIVYLEFYLSVDGTQVNASVVVATFKVPHVNLLNAALGVQVLVQVYIPDSLTATEADYVIIGVSVPENQDLTNAAFRSDLASKIITVYQNAKGKINSRRKKRSGSTSATIKDIVRKADSQASEVDVTFFVFDSGKVVNASYVVSVMNRLSTSDMTTLTRPYAILTAPRQAVVPTPPTEIPPTMASTPIKWWIIPAVICPILLLIIIILLIYWRWKKGAPKAKVEPDTIRMLETNKRRPVHGFDVARYTEPEVSSGMKTTAFMTRSPTSGADDEEAEVKLGRRETSLRRKVPKRPIQKLPAREQRQTNPAFEEEEDEEEESVSVTPPGSTEALTRERTAAKPPPVPRQTPAKQQRPVEPSEMDSEEDSQLSEEESESEPESVAPPEQTRHSAAQVPTVAVMSEASGPPRYPPVRFRSSVHPAPTLPPIDAKRTSLVGVRVEPPSEDDSTGGRRKGKVSRRELEQRAALERQKNKQRLRERKRNDSYTPETAVMTERKAWGRAQHDIDDVLGDEDAERVITGKKRRPRRRRPPSSSVATDEEGMPHLKSYRKLKSPKTTSSTSTRDRDKKRGKSADSVSNASSEEESEIDMTETRRRMHAMLDDAFSLFGPQLAKKPGKEPEGQPAQPAEPYTSTPARPAVIPRYIGGQPALPEPPPAHGRATEPTPGQRKRVQPTMPGYPVGMPQTPLGMPGYPGRPPVRPVVTRDPIVVWDPADRQRILNQRAPPPTYAYRDPSGQNVYITPVQQQRDDVGGFVWSPYAAEDSMDALYPDLAQTSYPGALGTSPPKDTSFLSHLQAMPPHDTVLNMSANSTLDQRGASLGQSPQPLIKSIKDELFRLSQGASRKTPITEL